MDIKERAAYKIGQPIESPEQAPYRVQTRIINAAWKERLDAKLAQICIENPEGHYKELAEANMSVSLVLRKTWTKYSAVASCGWETKLTSKKANLAIAIPIPHICGMPTGTKPR